MKILHTSDWHLGKSLENISRLNEQKDFIESLCAISDENDINLILIAGDVFDTYTPSSAAEELFYYAMDRLSKGGQRAIIAIAGNHDSPERLCAASPITYKNGIILLGYPWSNPAEFPISVQGINIIDAGPGWLEISIYNCKDNAIIITLPYPSESRLEEVLSSDSNEEKLSLAYSERIGEIFTKLSTKFREDTINLAMSHIFVQGCRESESERPIQLGGALTVSPKSLPKNAHYIALGHLHRPQQVGGTPSPTYYSGSPLAYSFSEADRSKAVYIIDAVPSEPATIEPVYIDSGKPLKCWIAENGPEQAIKWCEEGRDSNAWIDLTICTERVITTEEQKKMRSLNPGIINIRPKLKNILEQETRFENRENKKIDELFKEFYRFRTGVELPDTLMKTFMEILNYEETESTEAMTREDDIKNWEEGDFSETKIS